MIVYILILILIVQFTIIHCKRKENFEVYTTRCVSGDPYLKGDIEYCQVCNPDIPESIPDRSSCILDIDNTDDDGNYLYKLGCDFDDNTNMETIDGTQVDAPYCNDGKYGQCRLNRTSYNTNEHYSGCGSGFICEEVTGEDYSSKCKSVECNSDDLCEVDEYCTDNNFCTNCKDDSTCGCKDYPNANCEDGSEYAADGYCCDYNEGGIPYCEDYDGYEDICVSDVYEQNYCGPEDQDGVWVASVTGTEGELATVETNWTNVGYSFTPEEACCVCGGGNKKPYCYAERNNYGEYEAHEDSIITQTIIDDNPASPLGCVECYNDSHCDTGVCGTTSDILGTCVGCNTDYDCITHDTYGNVTMRKLCSGNECIPCDNNYNEGGDSCPVDYPMCDNGDCTKCDDTSVCSDFTLADGCPDGCVGDSDEDCYGYSCEEWYNGIPPNSDPGTITYEDLIESGCKCSCVSQCEYSDKPVCSIFKRCIECEVSDDCDADQVCDNSTNTCVECTRNEDCVDAGCKVNNECGECLHSWDCGEDSSTKQWNCSDDYSCSITYTS